MRRELEVKVQDVNLEAGTALDVAVDGVSVGTIKLRDNNDGELRLRTADGYGSHRSARTTSSPSPRQTAP